MSPYIGQPTSPATPVRTSIIRVVRFYAWIFSVFVVVGSVLTIVDIFLPQNSASIAGLMLPFFLAFLIMGLLGIAGLLRTDAKDKHNKLKRNIRLIVDGIIICLILLFLFWGFLVLMNR